MASSALAVTSALFLPFAIVKIILVIRKHSEELETSKFREKYGTLTEGLRTDKIIGRYWTVITLVRWATLGIILVVLRDFP
jgi:hypothetical protein